MQHSLTPMCAIQLYPAMSHVYPKNSFNRGECVVIVNYKKKILDIFLIHKLVEFYNYLKSTMFNPAYWLEYY